MLLLFATAATGQEQLRDRKNLPINVTVFSHAIGLPNFKGLFRNPNVGLKVGTEFYFASRSHRTFFQTVNLGVYRQRHFSNAFFVTSELGYRKWINHAYGDVTLGAGYMVLNSTLPRYELHQHEYRKASSTFGRIMPTVGLGAGYQFKSLTVFSRYEMFAEMPFAFKGLPALPHKSLHIGTRVLLKK